MNREIKFRAWSKLDNKFLYPYPEGFNLFGEITCFDLIMNQMHELHPEKETLLMLNDIEIVQFTGLYDKEGKEIYEGDILNKLRHEETNNWASKLVHRKDKIEEVTFAGGCFVIESTGEKVVDYIYSIVHHRVEATVIGNIYENPELLTN